LRSGAALKGINHILQGTCVTVRDAGASSLIRHSGFVIQPRSRGSGSLERLCARFRPERDHLASARPSNSAPIGATNRGLFPESATGLFPESATRFLAVKELTAKWLCSVKRPLGCPQQAPEAMCAPALPFRVAKYAQSFRSRSPAPVILPVAPIPRPPGGLTITSRLSFHRRMEFSVGTVHCLRATRHREKYTTTPMPTPNPTFSHLPETAPIAIRTRTHRIIDQAFGRRSRFASASSGVRTSPSLNPNPIRSAATNPPSPPYIAGAQPHRASRNAEGLVLRNRNKHVASPVKAGHVTVGRRKYPRQFQYLKENNHRKPFPQCGHAYPLIGGPHARPQRLPRLKLWPRKPVPT